MPRKIKETVSDPTLPKTPITVAGKTYDLCFEFGALAEAEAAINRDLLRAGRTDLVNLLFALPVQNLSNTRICFAAALRTFHPEIPFEAALKMITLGNMWEIANAVQEAWRVAAADPAPGPPKAQG